MKRIGSVGLVLVMVLLGSTVLQAQDDILPRGEPRVRPLAPRPATVTTGAPGSATTATPGVSPQTEPALSSGDGLEEAFHVVVHALQLTEDQALGLRHLLEMRREAIAPLLQGIAQREMQIQQLLQNGGAPAEIGQLVIEIHQLRQLIQQAQMSFMAAFFDLLNDQQEQRFHQIELAERLQRVLPAFKALHLL
ncbi:MAG: hypothetical protein L0212_08110 [Acidobacteria bacterium]|nr:hypothetical protein [Acidobacteriota bacterium]